MVRRAAVRRPGQRPTHEPPEDGPTARKMQNPSNPSQNPSPRAEGLRDGIQAKTPVARLCWW